MRGREHDLTILTPDHTLVRRVNDFQTSSREREKRRARAEKEESDRKRRREDERQRSQSDGREGGARRENARMSGGVTFEFDVSDPYAVLGVSRGATSAAISRAFRTEMLRWHPDTLGPDASEKERTYAVERSKLITSAFQILKKKSSR